MENGVTLGFVGVGVGLLVALALDMSTGVVVGFV